MGRFVHRIQTPAERDGHRSVFDALEFRIVSLVGQSDLLAVNMELGGNIAGLRDPIVDVLIQKAEGMPTIESAMIAGRALDRVLLWGFYHIPLSGIDEERFVF